MGGKTASREKTSKQFHQQKEKKKEQYLRCKTGNPPGAFAAKKGIKNRPDCKKERKKKDNTFPFRRGKKQGGKKGGRHKTYKKRKGKSTPHLVGRTRKFQKKEKSTKGWFFFLGGNGVPTNFNKREKIKGGTTKEEKIGLT